MTVHFIGAGPGAPDLITLRGRDLIARSPVCLYAGSLVPRALLEYCPKGARIMDTAPMSLDGICAEFSRAHREAEDVARLHSGDLSIWSALGEQIRAVERLSIPYTITPGVPAFAAAAQNLRRRAPGGLRDRRRDIEIFRAGQSQDFPGAARGFYARDESVTGAGFRATR